MRSQVRVVSVVVLMLLAGACTGNRDHAAPKPPPNIPDVTTTTEADFSGVALAAVPGRTTTTIALGPGGATITGMVLAPEGPVPGAAVHVERLVGDGVAAADIASDATGRYTVPAVLGGRYRVRAFVPNPVNLAQATPAIFFLAATESKVQDLQVTHFNGPAVVGVIAPNPPPVDGPANLVVQVALQGVDPKGVVRGTPIVNANVVLAGSSAWQVDGPSSGLTDGGGRVAFRLTCTAEGPQPLQAVIDNQSYPLDIGPCTVPPPPTTTTTTTTPPPTTTTTPPKTTTTVRRPGTTTSTTKKGA
jgi:hypothetical protein